MSITFYLLHLGFGGIETSTINTANALSDFYDINILSFYHLSKDQKDFISPKVHVKYLYEGGPNKEEFKKALKSFNPIKIIKEIYISIKILYLKKHLIIREMKNSKTLYNISTRNEFSTLLSKYGKGTLIAQEHMHHNDSKKYINNIKYKFKNIDYLFALTNSLKSDYELFLKDNHHTKVVLVPNMIDIPNVKSNFNNNLITISRLHPNKRIGEMIDIFSKLKDKSSKLYIIGDGEELNNLKELVKEKDLENRVVFTGYLTKEEMKKYILDSKVFLMTSLTEGLPMVLLEAMSYGIPCIAYKTRSGVADIIDNDINGYIIDDRNEEEYIEKLNYLLENEEKLVEFSNNALEKANNFSKENVINIWKSIIK